ACYTAKKAKPKGREPKGREKGTEREKGKGKGKAKAKGRERERERAKGKRGQKEWTDGKVQRLHRRRAGGAALQVDREREGRLRPGRGGHPPVGAEPLVGLPASPLAGAPPGQAVLGRARPRRLRPVATQVL